MNKAALAFFVEIHSNVYFIILFFFEKDDRYVVKARKSCRVGTIFN